MGHRASLSSKKEQETIRSNHLRVTALVAAMLAAALSALFTSVGPAGAAFPGSNGKIAFASDRATIFDPEGDFEIFAINPDGTGLEQLTFNDDYDLTPTWSADGQQIAFASDRDGDFEIFTMDANGTNQTKLTNNSLNDLDPAWSPNGKRIVFTRIVGADNYEIVTIMATGEDPARLTTNPAEVIFPGWQPQ